MSRTIVLTNDPGIGVAGHVDAGYEKAKRTGVWNSNGATRLHAWKRESEN